MLISSFNNEHERGMASTSFPQPKRTHLFVRNFPYSFRFFGAFNLSNGRNKCSRTVQTGRPGKTPMKPMNFMKMHFT